MNSEFESLAKKIAQLSELTQTLRSENAELRRDAVALAARNLDLQQRIDHAHQRVSGLLALLPTDSMEDEEAA